MSDFRAKVVNFREKSVLEAFWTCLGSLERYPKTVAEGSWEVRFMPKMGSRATAIETRNVTFLVIFGSEWPKVTHFRAKSVSDCDILRVGEV